MSFLFLVAVGAAVLACIVALCVIAFQSRKRD